MLEDLEARYPDATLVGVDLIAAGLRKAHERLPRVRLLQADACRLPIADGTLDAVVSANLLEHIPDDRLALAEMRASPAARRMGGHRGAGRTRHL